MSEQNTASDQAVPGGQPPKSAKVRPVQSARLAKRLAFLLPNLGGGGVQKNTLTIAKGLAASGYPIDLLLCSDQGPLRCQVPEEFNLIKLDSAPLWRSRVQALATAGQFGSSLLKPIALARKPSKSLRKLPALADYLRAQRPAALLAATVHLNVEAALARRLAGTDTRLIVTQSHQFSQWHGVSGEWRRRFILPLTQKAYLDASAIVAVSQGVADDLERYLQIPSAKVRVIHNPVVTPELTEGMVKAVDHPWFKAGEPPVILSVGRPGRQKDFATLLRAFAKVTQRVPARLLILGEARDPNKKQRRKSELLDLAERLGVAQAVDFQGFVHNPFAYMANAAIFVLSSRYEGFGNVLAEALACGCQVISTDCPSGPSEILQNGACGKLVPVGDVDAMANAICESLAKPVDKSRLQDRASAFALEPIIERYREILLGT